MDTNKSVPVVNIPPVRFICGPIRQRRKSSTQGDWGPEILVSVITTVGIPLEEDFAGIVMKSRNVVIHMDFDDEAF